MTNQATTKTTTLEEIKRGLSALRTEDMCDGKTHYFATTPYRWECFTSISEAREWLITEASGSYHRLTDVSGTWHVCKVPAPISAFYTIDDDTKIPQIEGTQIVFTAKDIQA